MYDIKPYHLYKFKKSNNIILSLSNSKCDDCNNDEREYFEAIAIPMQYMIESNSKDKLYKKIYVYSDAVEEVILEEFNIYKPQLKIKIPSLKFYSIKEMAEYYKKYPLKEYSVSYNIYTKKITLNKRNCVIDNSTMLDMPILDIEEKNIDILKNFGFVFEIVDKYIISHKEMYFLLSHQEKDYYFEKKDNITIIYNQQYKTETNNLFLHLPDINKISIFNLIEKCIVDTYVD